MKVLIIDNYDSFTYNLYQYIGEILIEQGKPFTVEVKRNDEITLASIAHAHYDRIILSPGPGRPDDPSYFGVCKDIILKMGKTTPVLGVCLGMQGIAHYFGGRVIKAKVPLHGKTSSISHDGKGVFKGLPQKLEVMRYHSLIADPARIPDCLEVSAKAINGKIMGLRHKHLAIEGIQFHPESFATEAGKDMLKNFLA